MAHRWGNRSRHERGYDSRWTKLRERILARDSINGDPRTAQCQPCKREGRTVLATSVDHITPKAKGGTDDPANLEAICTPCHQAKSLKEAAEAQGRTYRPKPKMRFDASGFPVWPEGR